MVGPALRQQPGPWPTPMEGADVLDPSHLPARFLAKIDQSGPCWLWTGYTEPADGYPRVWPCSPSGTILAHRAAYELLVGPIADGLDLDHLCGVRRCVNPSHLEPVTPRENADRIDYSHRHRQVCKNGHPMTPENTYEARGRNGQTWHQCRTCRRDWDRRRRSKT